MREFGSKINAFRMDASPSLNRLDYEEIMKKMEGKNIIVGLKET